MASILPNYDYLPASKRFHLYATPNFSARLKELGIDPEEYEKDQYLKLPTVQ